jgi:hypothetical protein
MTLPLSQKNARFSYVNWLQPGNFTTTAVNPVLPNELNNGVRSKTWKAKGTFEITTANQAVYINGTTYNIPVGSYDVAGLITAFDTETGEELTRNAFGRFVITLGSSGTLNLSSTANSIWSTLGFLSTTNATGTVFTADERRYSTGEWVKVDVGFSQIPDFAALIGPANEVFSCSTGIVRLQGNNVDDWANPSVNLVMETSNHGAFIAPNITMACRYWRLLVLDVKNSNMSLSVAHIGFSTIVTNTNISTGFNRVRLDQSERLYSEGGQLYVDRRPKLMTFTGASVGYLKDQELVEMEQLFYDLGVGRPFFLCTDPSKSVSTSLAQMTHYVQLDSDASFNHILNSYYTLGFSMREVL